MFLFTMEFFTNRVYWALKLNLTSASLLQMKISTAQKLFLLNRAKCCYKILVYVIVSHILCLFFLEINRLMNKYVIVCMVFRSCDGAMVFVALWDHMAFHFVVAGPFFIQVKKFNRQSLRKKICEHISDHKILTITNICLLSNNR